MTTNTSREEQYVAALCHLSLLVPLMGLSVPLVVWLTLRKESAFLRFQALQALTYQAVGMLAQFLFSGLQAAIPFVFFLFIIVLAVISSAVQSSAIVGVGLVITFILLWGGMLLFLILQGIGGLIYLVLGFWGALQLIRGRAFRYPLLGKWIDRRLNPPQPVVDSQSLPA